MIIRVLLSHFWKQLYLSPEIADKTSVMVGRLLNRSLLAMALGLVGCTVAAPDVSSIMNLPSFSNKSDSPFLQENLGGAIFFSGECLPGVTGFQFRLNELPAWQSIPTLAPLPDLNPMLGEYLVGTPAYDLDCSDGTFDFYVFQTAAMNYFTINSYPSNPADPASIELRSVGIEGLPTLMFRRPTPTTFEVQKDFFTFNNLLENSRAYTFRVRLKGANNSYAIFGAGESKQINITLADTTAPALAAGMIYESNCTSAVTAAYLTFAPFEEEKIFCYVASGTTDHHLIRADVSATGMISTPFYIQIKPINSVVTFLNSSGTNSVLPTTLLKGVAYTFQSGIVPLYAAGMSRTVQSFNGTLAVYSTATTVEFKQNGGDSDCPVAWTPALINCTMTSPGKAFQLRIDNSHSTDTATVGVSTSATPGCTGCKIQEGAGFFPISTYQPNQIEFKVMSGLNLYDHPHFSPQDGVMRLGSCASIEVALANVDGTILPGFSKSFVVSVNSAYAQIYSDYTCSSIGAASTSVPFATGDIVKRIFYKVNALPPGGQIEWNINDGTNVFLRYYYTTVN